MVSIYEARGHQAPLRVNNFSCLEVGDHLDALADVDDSTLGNGYRSIGDDPAIVVNRQQPPDIAYKNIAVAADRADRRFRQLELPAGPRTRGRRVS